MYKSCECLSHVRRRPKLRDILRSTFNLITHGDRYIIAWYQAFIIDESFCPDLSIGLVLRIEVLAHIILQLCNTV